MAYISSKRKQQGTLSSNHVDDVWPGKEISGLRVNKVYSLVEVNPLYCPTAHYHLLCFETI